MTSERPPQQTLAAAEWRRRAEAHRARAAVWTAPARARHAAGRPHPVLDFLFTYYSYPLAKLEQWHPGAGWRLEVDGELPGWLARDPYRAAGGTVAADPGCLSPAQLERLRWIRALLAATAERPPNFACCGMHEWAMVYRGREVRHQSTLPLRLPQAEIDRFVESRPVCCSHHDAFRFFPPEARPLNRLQPDLDRRLELEQPGCVHANMDLYKWAFKTMPWGGGELLLGCFELAVELRWLDMRASPYDVRAFGGEPVAVETPAGRAEYERLQQELAGRAAPLRVRLSAVLDGVLAAATGWVVTRRR